MLSSIQWCLNELESKTNDHILSDIMENARDIQIPTEQYTSPMISFYWLWNLFIVVVTEQELLIKQYEN
jgi:hypothetical protein